MRKAKQERDYDRAWREAIEENEKRDYDKAWEEAIKENEKRDYDKAWEEAIIENSRRDWMRRNREKRDYDKEWEGPVEDPVRMKRNPVIRKYDEGWEEEIYGGQRIEGNNGHNGLRTGNDTFEEPEIEADNIDASNNKDIDNDEIIGNNLNKENLVININVKKGIIETKLGLHKEKIKIKTLFKQLKYLSKQLLVTELIPYIIENIDDKYHTSRLENFEGLYYLDDPIDMNKYGNIDINFNLKKLYKIFRPSVPIGYQRKFADMAKVYEDYGLATVKTGLKTSLINKIRSISKKLISLPKSRKIERIPAKTLYDYEKEGVYEPDFEPEKESNKEDIYDKYKVNNEHNEIEEQARENMESSADRSESSVLSNEEKDF